MAAPPVSSIKLGPEELATIAARTLEHYEQRAENFWEGTRDHDVSQNIAALLRHIEGVPPFAILDFGCGPGRDLKTLRALGPRARSGWRAPRASRRWRARTADARSGSRISCALDLPRRRFDGVFANAALFHVPTQELPRVLRELRAALKPRGVLFSSNPRGDNEEGWNRGRYGAYHDLETWRALSCAARASPSSSTTTARPGCRATSSPGSPPLRERLEHAYPGR